MARKKPSQSQEPQNGNGATAQHDAKSPNGSLANGSTKPGATPPPAQKQAGVAELVICVAGIYASL